MFGEQSISLRLKEDNDTRKPEIERHILTERFR